MKRNFLMLLAFLCFVGCNEGAVEEPRIEPNEKPNEEPWKEPLSEGEFGNMLLFQVRQEEGINLLDPDYADNLLSVDIHVEWRGKVYRRNEANELSYTAESEGETDLLALRWGNNHPDHAEYLLAFGPLDSEGDYHAEPFALVFGDLIRLSGEMDYYRDNTGTLIQSLRMGEIEIRNWPFCFQLSMQSILAGKEAFATVKERIEQTQAEFSDYDPKQVEELLVNKCWKREAYALYSSSSELEQVWFLSGSSVNPVGGSLLWCSFTPDGGSTFCNYTGTEEGTVKMILTLGVLIHRAEN